MTRYYGLKLAECTAQLTSLAPALRRLIFAGPEALHAWLVEEALGLHPFLRCALDVAAHDPWAKRAGKRLGALLQVETPR